MAVPDLSESLSATPFFSKIGRFVVTALDDLRRDAKAHATFALPLALMFFAITLVSMRMMETMMPEVVDGALTESVATEHAGSIMLLNLLTLPLYLIITGALYTGQINRLAWPASGFRVPLPALGRVIVWMLMMIVSMILMMLPMALAMAIVIGVAKGVAGDAPESGGPIFFVVLVIAFVLGALMTWLSFGLPARALGHPTRLRATRSNVVPAMIALVLTSLLLIIPMAILQALFLVAMQLSIASLAMEIGEYVILLCQSAMVVMTSSFVSSILTRVHLDRWQPALAYSSR